MKLSARFYHVQVDNSWQKTVKNGIMPAWNQDSLSAKAIGVAPFIKGGTRFRLEQTTISNAALVSKRGIFIFS